MKWHLSNNYNPKDGTYLVYFEGEYNIFTISENKWFDQMGFLIDGDDRYHIWWTELPEPPRKNQKANLCQKDNFQFIYQRRNIMSNTTKGPFMQAMEKYTKSIKTFISAQGFGHYSKPTAGRLKTTARDITSEEFVPKVWSGLTSFNGYNVWTDGAYIYYSSGSTQKVLNEATSAWNNKAWSGLTSFDGYNIWTDGENIYYSSGFSQYVLNKAASAWTTKTWTGLNAIEANNIWTDGENIYYSYLGNQCVLNKSTSTWSTKTWTGLSSFYGYLIWTDGDNIYYSNQYVLDKSTSTWNPKTWSGLTSFDALRIWTDGENIYYSDGSTKYILDKSTSTWNSKTWSGLTSFDGSRIWTDGENIYYSDDSDQYLLKRNTPNTHEVMGYVNDKIGDINSVLEAVL